MFLLELKAEVLPLVSSRKVGDGMAFAVDGIQARTRSSNAELILTMLFMRIQ
jgi:hypothetical protein